MGEIYIYLKNQLSQHYIDDIKQVLKAFGKLANIFIFVEKLNMVEISVENIPMEEERNALFRALTIISFPPYNATCE